MAHYILLLNWTEQGARNVKDSPKRLDAARDLAKKMGCTFGSFHMTMGAYDMVVTMDAPDDDTMAKFALSMVAAGNIRSTTLKAFSEDAYRKIISAV